MKNKSLLILILSLFLSVVSYGISDLESEIYSLYNSKTPISYSDFERIDNLDRNIEVYVISLDDKTSSYPLIESQMPKEIVDIKKTFEGSGAGQTEISTYNTEYFNKVNSYFLMDNVTGKNYLVILSRGKSSVFMDIFKAIISSKAFILIMAIVVIIALKHGYNSKLKRKRRANLVTSDVKEDKESEKGKSIKAIGRTGNHDEQFNEALKFAVSEAISSTIKEEYDKNRKKLSEFYRNLEEEKMSLNKQLQEEKDKSEKLKKEYESKHSKLELEKSREIEELSNKLNSAKKEGRSDYLIKKLEKEIRDMEEYFNGEMETLRNKKDEQEKSSRKENETLIRKMAELEKKSEETEKELKLQKEKNIKKDQEIMEYQEKLEEYNKNFTESLSNFEKEKMSLNKQLQEEKDKSEKLKKEYESKHSKLELEKSREIEELSNKLNSAKKEGQSDYLIKKLEKEIQDKEEKFNRDIEILKKENNKKEKDFDEAINKLSEAQETIRKNEIKLKETTAEIGKLTSLLNIAKNNGSYVEHISENLTERVIEEINSAKKSIFIQMYTFTSIKVMYAILKAVKKGIKVSILLDRQKFIDNILKENHDLLSHYRSIVNTYTKTIQIKSYTPKSGYKYASLHKKLTIIDKEKYLIGSANYTEHGFEGNSEVLVLIKDEKTATELLNEACSIWKDSENIKSLINNHNIKRKY